MSGGGEGGPFFDLLREPTFGCILIDFWLTFGSLWLPFGSLWLPFGSLLASFGSLSLSPGHFFRIFMYFRQKCRAKSYFYIISIQFYIIPIQFSKFSFVLQTIPAALLQHSCSVPAAVLQHSCSGVTFFIFLCIFDKNVVRNRIFT